MLGGAIAGVEITSAPRPSSTGLDALALLRGERNPRPQGRRPVYTRRAAGWATMKWRGSGGEPVASGAGCARMSASRPGEHRREVTPVAAGGAVEVSEADVGVVRVEKVGAVWGAVHPPVEGLLRRAGGRVARGVDVLSHPRPVVTLPSGTIPSRRSVGAGVGEVVVAGHVGAVLTRRGLQLALKIVCLEPLALALLIDQRQEPAFEGRIPRRVAGRGDRRRWRAGRLAGYGRRGRRCRAFLCSGGRRGLRRGGRGR